MIIIKITEKMFQTLNQSQPITIKDLNNETDKSDQNSTDLDQTAPTRAVYSRPALFAILSAFLDPLLH